MVTKFRGGGPKPFFLTPTKFVQLDGQTDTPTSSCTSPPDDPEPEPKPESEPEPELEPKPEPESEPEPEPELPDWTLNYDKLGCYAKVNVENLLKQKSTSTNVQCCSNFQNINFSTAEYLECNSIDSITNIKCNHHIARKIHGTTFFLSQQTML